MVSVPIRFFVCALQTTGTYTEPPVASEQLTDHTAVDWCPQPKIVIINPIHVDATGTKYREDDNFRSKYVRMMALTVQCYVLHTLRGC